MRLRASAILAVLLLGACGQQDRAQPNNTDRPPEGSTRPRIAVVVMENKEYDEVIGSNEAPYVNGLARTSALASEFYGTTHPSLPNYLALTGGGTFGVTTNCTDCTVSERSLVDQLEEAGISWKAYMESMPRPCFARATAGRYAKKHNPFAYYERIMDDRDRCRKVVPLDELDRDLRGGTLPTFVWITPDMCHGTHDCSVRTGDRFLSRLLPPLLRKLGDEGVLILTYDEGTSERGCCSQAAGGRIVTLVAGPGAEPGRYDTPLTHYSILRAIQDRWDLPRLGKAASPATPPMDALFRHD